MPLCYENLTVLLSEDPSSIPFRKRKLTKGMSGTGSLLDAVQLAETIGTTPIGKLRSEFGKAPFDSRRDATRQASFPRFSGGFGTGILDLLDKSESFGLRGPMGVCVVPEDNFMDAQLGFRPSWTWRSILQGQRVLKYGCLKRISSGNNCKIWGDPWVPKQPFVLRSRPPAHFHPDAPVSILIDSGSRLWNSTLVNDLFPKDEAKLILSIPLSTMASPDRWYWFHSKNGKFTVKSAYHLIMDNPNDFVEAAEFGISSSGHSPIWKKLWSLKIPSRVIHFGWKLLSRTLPCPENLARRHLSHPEHCPFCGSYDLSSAHTFFSCPIAAQVWALAGLSENIAAFKQDSGDLWARDILLGQPSDIGAYVLTLCSGIWYAFNQTIFEDTPAAPIGIVSSASLTLASFRDARLWPERPSQFLSSTLSTEKAPPGTHIFFDGALSSTQACAGVGVCLVSSDGCFIKGYAKHFPGITNPDVAEALALREAVFLALAHRYSHISFLGDSANIILAASGSVDPHPDYAPILEDIKHLCVPLNIGGFFWISRLENFPAHEFAHYAKMSRCTKTRGIILRLFVSFGLWTGSVINIVIFLSKKKKNNLRHVTRTGRD
ncbi:hypothetical protein DH2020_014854 [Rehmannia glutinosa]|uniref:Reverse transcriptase zinc-binding domain-containing protein n=1 Tax=Rehmannia glutinosa TaxID=99300 RepID=A0ABR0X0X6_REHGL